MSDPKLPAVCDNSEDEYVVDLTRSENEYCPICECSNGHSLSCATFRFNRIEGSVADEPKLIDAVVEKEI